MFERITPEQAGISSERVAQYIEMLEQRGMNTHGLLMMKGDKVFAECYWRPFHQDYCHRMYSQTKSFVGIAIGLLLEDGKINLDDKICDYFLEKIDGKLPRELREQTIRQMLTMTTVGKCKSWFREKAYDRTKIYFEQRVSYRAAGTLWEYDSPGSQVLCSLVEKLSGQSMLDFLNERLFSHMGTFQNASVLQAPNGDSWGDSAMICTLRDMASFGRLLMNKGCWDDKQLISEAYVKEATSAIVDNRINCHEGVFRHGYGYQIWRTEQNGFAFNGMGGQYTVCLPDKDLLFSIISDNQGKPESPSVVVGGFMDYIASSMQEQVLPDNVKEQDILVKMSEKLTLRAIQGKADSPLREQISGATYSCEVNALGIKEITFVFNGTESGEFHYINEQGKKVIPFGINKNVFGKFPQLGYANEYGNVETTDGFMYDDAVSLCWSEDNRILMQIQIIDKYLGQCSATFAFHDDVVVCHFEKFAEYFLNEYEGDFKGRKK